MKTKNANSNELLTYVVSEPLHEAKKASVQIIADDGNLTIDQLTNADQVLVSGHLQYFAKQGPPARALEVKDGQIRRFPEWRRILPGFSFARYGDAVIRSGAVCHVLPAAGREKAIACKSENQSESASKGY